MFRVLCAECYALCALVRVRLLYSFEPAAAALRLALAFPLTLRLQDRLGDLGLRDILEPALVAELAFAHPLPASTCHVAFSFPLAGSLVALFGCPFMFVFAIVAFATPL